MLAIQSQTLYFDSSQTLQCHFSFNNIINDYGVVLQGFDMRYDNDTDHKVRSLGVEINNVSLSTDRTILTAEVKLTLKDNSKNVGSGLVDVVAVVDLKS
ncbi:MAG: hypothetical protein K2X28_07875 [Alphaproteobacteria bacterium]|jgi:hypothetical protein|nr:hypothetical protein [Alphaproteobacteria bacterium]